MTFSKACAAALLLATAPAWAINKCTLADGSVAYQDAPCEVKRPANRDDLAELRKASAAKPAMTESNADFVRRTNAELAEAARGDAAERQRAQSAVDQVCKGKTHERPLVGMTEATVLNCLDTGAPMLVHETQTASAISRQYAYERTRSGMRYLYTRNGIVTVVTR